MSRKRRDYAAEYARRIARGRAQELSRSAARGHPRAGEIQVKPQRAAADAKLKKALTKLQGGASLTQAAKSTHVSPERLRKYLQDRGLARRAGRTWIVADAKARRVPVISDGKIRSLLVSEFEAERAGRYWRDVGRFVRSNDLKILKRYRGEGVRTIEGRFAPLETDPNVLHRLASASLPAFHEIYAIVQP